MKSLELRTKGMHCSSCEKVISMELEDTGAVKVKKINHKTGAIFLSYNPEMIDEKKIKKIIKDEGYEVE